MVPRNLVYVEVFVYVNTRIVLQFVFVGLFWNHINSLTYIQFPTRGEGWGGGGGGGAPELDRGS